MKGIGARSVTSPGNGQALAAHAPSMDALPKRTAEIAERLRAATRVTLLPYASADGIAGAAVLRQALERAGTPVEVAWVRDPAAPLPGARGLAVCLDVGGAHAPSGAVVCDHHAFLADHAGLLHPRAFGLDANAMSSAGLAYLLARALDPSNAGLAWLAVVGALAELQDAEARRLVGPNRDPVLADAQAAGSVEARLDLRAPGRGQLPVAAMLAGMADPALPGLAGDEEAAERWLERQVPLREAGRPRRWADLAMDEQRRVLAGMAGLLLRSGRGAASARRLVGETYTLLGEPPGSPLRDAHGFAALLAACASSGACDAGLAIASGARGPVLRRVLAARPARVSAASVVQGVLVQHVDAGPHRPPAAGTLLDILYLQDGVHRDRPLVAFARAETGATCITARASRDAVRRGLRLAHAARAAAGALHGSATGDDHAVEGVIPAGSERAFLAEMERLLAVQAHMPSRE